MQSKNKTFEGDSNPFNKEHCMPCASILLLVSILEKTLSQPNIAGQVRKVKLTAQIEK